MHFKRDAIIFFAATLLVLPWTYAAALGDSTLVPAASAPSVSAKVLGGLMPTPQPTPHETQGPAAQAAEGLLSQADAGASPEWDDDGEASKCGHCGHHRGCGWHWPSWCCW